MLHHWRLALPLTNHQNVTALLDLCIGNLEPKWPRNVVVVVAVVVAVAVAVAAAAVAAVAAVVAVAVVAAVVAFVAVVAVVWDTVR